MPRQFRMLSFCHDALMMRLILHLQRRILPRYHALASARELPTFHSHDAHRHGHDTAACQQLVMVLSVVLSCEEGHGQTRYYL